MNKIISRIKCLSFYIFSILLFVSPQVHAHHPGHNSGSNRTLAPVYQSSSFSSGSVRPRSMMSLTYRYESLDNDLGDRSSLNLFGEYSFNSKLSVGASIPLIGYHFDQAEGVKGFGDLGVHGKYTIYSNVESEWYVISTLALTLPTGNEHRSLGNDGFSVSPGLSMVKYWSNVYGFMSGRPNFFFIDGEDTVSLDYSIGFGVEILKEKFPFDVILSLDGNTFLKDASFHGGDTKLYLTPGVLFKPYDHINILVFGFFDMADSLSVKSGVNVSNTSSELLTDIGHGGGIHFNYFFGRNGNEK